MKDQIIKELVDLSRKEYLEALATGNETAYGKAIGLHIATTSLFPETEDMFQAGFKETSEYWERIKW